MAIEITGVPTTPLSGNKTDESKTNPNNISGKDNQNTKHIDQQNGAMTAPPVDKITLTQQAKELSMIEKAVSEQADIDNERIENLKLEIDSGRYDIDAQRVAEKLIEFEIQFVA